MNWFDNISSILAHWTPAGQTIDFERDELLRSMFWEAVEDHPEIADDEQFLALFSGAFLDINMSGPEQDSLRHELYVYFESMYGDEFMYYFDWDAYREWYDSQ